MIHLHSRHNQLLSACPWMQPAILRVTDNPRLPAPLRAKHALRLRDTAADGPEGFGLMLISSGLTEETPDPLPANVVRLAPELDYLERDDVIKFHPESGAIQVLYRRKANANSFLVTERCNSFCIMCSQPPRVVDDHGLVEDMLEALPLIHTDTVDIGITGGEPTLWGDDFIRLIEATKAHLPRTALHILSNGRNFQNLELAKQVAQVKHPDLMIGIPLYADYSVLHDYIVQADGAFDETLRGILNLKRCRQKVELRVVIQKDNWQRLPRLAEFIVRNLLFVDHVALMGLEIMGFAKSNLEAVWVDPHDYRQELADATETLVRYGLNVSVYNHPWCVLPEAVRPFAVKSISDWKNEYFEECQTCSVKADCGGFFSSHRYRRSTHIRAL
jgi:His-Xaa-Ser system radical SAM maturase HxsC